MWLLDEFGLDWLSPTIPHENIVLPKNDSRWIVLSSFLFSIPAVHYLLLTKGKNVMSTFFCFLLCITSIVSANYWRDVKRGFRRNADLIVSKITFLTGALLIPRTRSSFIAGLILFASYAASSHYRRQHDRIWILIHILFHTVLMLCAYAILF
jgi:hypothetical protein